MKMSFWSHCQGLVRRLQQGRMVRRRRPRCWSLRAESLEVRTLLSSTPAMLTDITAGVPRDVVAIGSTVYFSANDGVHGNELWKSNGTIAGTGMVTDLRPGAASSYPSQLTNVNGTLFFTANDGVHGFELWKSNGTAAGTVMVADISPGSRSSYLADLTNVNGTLFFAAYEFNSGGYSLWKSDGTAAGTTMVTDSISGDGPEDLTDVNGTLFFASLDLLWKSDGTAAGTVPIMHFTNPSWPSNLTNVNGTLFFAANDGVHGNELWKSDGTTAGTTMVKDINPGSSWYSVPYTTPYGTYYRSEYLPNSSNPSGLTNVNGTLFFEANDGVDGVQLWKSDGTDAGTTMVAAGTANFLGSPNINGTFFFQGYDSAHGYELWKSDGTAAGTALVADINPGPASSSPGYLTNANGTLFFTANDGVHGVQLWALNGTPAPSLGVSGFPPVTTAGSVGSFTITAENPNGSTNAGYTGTILLSSTDAKAVFGDSATGNPLAGDTYTFTAADNGTHTFTVQFKTAGSQSITAVDKQNASDSGAETGILVNPAAASAMIVSGFPSPITAGTAGNFTVTIKDAYGNIATGYADTVHFTSSDGKAALPANYTFTTADAGTHTFSATLKTAGTQSITSADTLMSALKATEGGITVNAAAASKFVLTAPSTLTAGVPFSLTLTVEDAYGNIVTGYTGTLHFTSTDSTARLPANYTFTAADNGVHRFVGLVLRKRGKQTVTITDMLHSTLTASVVENVM